MPESIDDVAGRLERAADRYQNANDFGAANAARQAAEHARRAGSVSDAQMIEQDFFRARAQTGPQADLSQNRGCLGGLFGTGGGTTAGPWRSTTARPSPSYSSYRPGMIRSYFSGPAYRNYTVYHAVARHAPPGHPNPDSYAASVADRLGFAGSATIGALTAAELASLSDAIESDWQRAQPPLGSAADGARSEDYRDRDRYRDTNTSSGYADSGPGVSSDAYSSAGGGADFAEADPLGSTVGGAASGVGAASGFSDNS
jgi:hypothetical protein